MPAGLRGAKPTPRALLARATPYKAVRAHPPEHADVPTQLSIWGNDQYGDCVTAEEAFAKIADLPNVYIDESTVIAWARKHGWLNGAYLTEVMDAMIQEGITASDGTNYKDGHYTAVDWTDREQLSNAIYEGPVKIAVAADQLQSTPGCGDHNGWFGTDYSHDDNIDHCVSLCGYGSLQFLFNALGVSLPAGADPSAFGYLLFTWSTIGVIDEASMVAITSEAWKRTPTTAGFPDPVDPTPEPTPTPIPTPPPPAVLKGFTDKFYIDVPAQGPFRPAFKVKVDPVPVTVTMPAPTDELSMADVEHALFSAGETPAKYSLTPDQWMAIIKLVLQILPIIFGQQGLRGRIGRLTPQQWAAIIQLVLQILPMFL